MRHTLQLKTLVIIETFEGRQAAAPGRCRVCGWEGWDTWDIGLVEQPDGTYEHDAEPEGVCPCCGLREVDVMLGGDAGDPDYAPAGGSHCSP